MKRGGWFRDSHRHSLAARGIKTRRYNYIPDEEIKRRILLDELTRSEEDFDKYAKRFAESPRYDYEMEYELEEARMKLEELKRKAPKDDAEKTMIEVEQEILAEKIRRLEWQLGVSKPPPKKPVVKEVIKPGESLPDVILLRGGRAPFRKPIRLGMGYRPGKRRAV